MNDVRIGRILRALRLRRDWRQVDLARASKLSQQAISLIERGHLDTLSIRLVRGAFAALDARCDSLVSWRGGAVDRLLDERHALLVGRVADQLRQLGWEVHVEVTFSVYGERGSIDIVALRRDLDIVLIVEIKTELTAIDDTIRRLDVKDRLASQLIGERFGWTPMTVGRLLVVLDGSTNRRRVAAHDSVLDAAFPVRGDAVAAWLRKPSGGISALRFVSLTNARGTGRSGPPESDDQTS